MYAKNAFGERLTYQPDNLHEYAGEKFCLRITPENTDLDHCFFVYLDEKLESWSVRKLLQTYFAAPGPQQQAEISSWMQPWLHMDPMLPKKYMLLRRMFGKVREQSGKVNFYINHGPGFPINPEDSVRSHLGTSVFQDGSFNDKILDVVLEFNAEGETQPELQQWMHFAAVDTATAGRGTKGPTRAIPTRRNIVGSFVFLLLAIFMLPFLMFRCNGPGGRGGGGFGGGML